MAIKPILFNTEMVRAILDGRKSCTRRLVKPEPQGYFEVSEEPLYVYDTDGKQGKITPPYQPGDILYVRETFAWQPCWDCGMDAEQGGYEHEAERRLHDKKKEHGCYMYRASCEDNEYPSVDTWHPSIHMPKEAARIWLKVKNVRVERLQEMKPVDVIKEGAYPDCWDCLNTYEESGSQCCYGTEEQCSQCDGVMMEWEKLWNSTIKKTDLDRYSWDANPWVWVIKFERCEKPEGEN
nr:MAG TPA: ASCH domain protein [Bacteriophage sp.]